MKVQGNRSTIAVVTTLVMAALILTALVAVIGSAQAAPSNKNYSVTVRLKSTSPSTVLTITLTNDKSSKQTLGSANLTAPVGMTPSSTIITSPATGWQASVLPGRIVAFRSTNAVKPGDSVSADVTVTNTGCTNATWTAAAKQSNDFSGSGNDFTLGTASTNLRPLGSLSIADIGTEVDDPGTPTVETLFVPQILVSAQEDLALSANDVCGASYPNYGGVFGTGATLEPKATVPPDPARLVNADISTIAWSSATTGAAVGTGTATLVPADPETGDRLVVADQFANVADESNEFDVVEKICTVFDDTCHWSNGPSNKIQVDAAPPSDPDASLGIGFIDDDSFSCASGTSALGGQLIYINPRDYPATTGQSVAITYDKTVPGTSGNVANFGSCISKDNGVNWTAIGNCAHSPPVLADAAVVPCIESRGRVQGSLVLTLFFNPSADPLHGGR